MRNPLPMKPLSQRLHTLLRGRKSYLLLLLILVPAAVLVSLRLPQFVSRRPDFYQPARPDLTSAKIHLSAYYDDEKLLLSDLSQAHRQLSTTLSLLAKAKSQLAPNDRMLLDNLRGRLQDLGQARTSGSMTAETLRRTYQQLAAELKALIERSG